MGPGKRKAMWIRSGREALGKGYWLWHVIRDAVHRRSDEEALKSATNVLEPTLFLLVTVTQCEQWPPFAFSPTPTSPPLKWNYPSPSWGAEWPGNEALLAHRI